MKLKAEIIRELDNYTKHKYRRPNALIVSQEIWSWILADSDIYPEVCVVRKQDKPEVYEWHGMRIIRSSDVDGFYVTHIEWAH